MVSVDARRGLLGTELSESEARTCLERAEFGVLSLTNDDEAYAFPVSFGYNSGPKTLYFLFAFDGESKKREFVETTRTASFTVVESELPDEWSSVIISGTLAPLSDPETEAFAALADTATFPAMHTFEDYYDMDETEQSLYQLDVETMAARQARSEPLDDTTDRSED